MKTLSKYELKTDNWYWATPIKDPSYYNRYLFKFTDLYEDGMGIEQVYGVHTDRFGTRESRFMEQKYTFTAATMEDIVAYRLEN